MKVLIVDDLFTKQIQAVKALNDFDVVDFDTAECVMEGLLNLESKDYDLIIIDMGLPIRRGEPVQNEREGFRLLQELVNEEVFVPTIVFSSTDLGQEKIDYLKEAGYPFLGQAFDDAELREHLQNFILSEKEFDQQKNNYLEKKAI